MFEILLRVFVDFDFGWLFGEPDNAPTFTAMDGGRPDNG